MFGIISVGAIDCRDEEELCEEFAVYDTPVIKIFTENANDDGTTFKGQKLWKNISGKAAQYMQNFVRSVSTENYDAFADENPEKQKILIFTDRKSTAPLFRSLSKYYKDKLIFGEVKQKYEKELYDKFGITKVPTILALTDPYNYKGEIYETAEMKIDQLKKFLSNYAFSQKKQEKRIRNSEKV